jgi:transcriptional regulator with AAA-type ATPase domain/tetratricopeptide (TPR) repeat protein
MVVVPELLGKSGGMEALRATIARLLKSPVDGKRYLPVLIEGETGTGKSVLAKALHRASVRRDGPFISVNSPVITDALAESQLFGHERGAFTGAHEARPGFFQLADKGTLFLDEIGLMSMTLQQKLLTAIEDKTVRRMGAGRSESVDVWVIAATNESLETARREKRLREDLYQRLNGLTLRLPPLRERGEDIILLAQHFLERSCREHRFALKSLSEDARAALLASEWEGNVRQLAYIIERAALFSDADVIDVEALALPAARPPLPTVEASPSRQTPDKRDPAQIIAVYREEKGNLSRAATRLKIPRNTLRYRLKQLNVLVDDPRPAPDERPTALETSRQLRLLALLRVEVRASPSDRPSPVSEWLDIVDETVGSLGGREIERSATGLTAAFGLEPVEDAPSRAAHTATALLRAAERARADGEVVHLAVAVDVRRSLVEIGRDGVVLDEATRREAWERLEALGEVAEADTAVASEAAAAFLERRFELAPLDRPGGALRRIHRIVGHVRPGLGFGRRVATFVGRDNDLALLRAQLATAVKGQGRAIGIVGEAGIGKSRLVGEFRNSLSSDEVIWLEGACFSYARTIPYVPVLAILRASCGIGEADSTAVVTDRLRRRLESLDLNVDESLPFLLQLFGLREGTERLAQLTSEAIRRGTLEVFRQMILAASARRPVVIAVEDVHWADRASEEILNSLATGLPRVLLLSTYRAGFRPPPWMGRSFATQIALASLSPEDSRTMLYSVLEDDIPESLARMILDKAEGNPFFLEEIYRSVEGLGRPQTLPEVPGNIADVLLARIERLPPGPKSVLQAAAILGREVAWRLLEGVWRGEGSLEAHMAVLTELEFLYQRADARGRTYVFKHSLTQQVADEALPGEQRRQLHAAAGRALETLFADRLEEVYDRLAHHYSQTEEADKAVRYLTGLAEKAARGDALVASVAMAETVAREEAVLAWKDALQHVERLPPDVRDRRRLEILLSLAGSLLPLGRVDEVDALLGLERDRLERLKDPALAGRYYFMLARTAMLSEHGRVVEHAARAIKEAERCDDAATMGGAYGVLAVACVLSGQAEQGIGYAQKAVSLLEQTTNQWSLSYACWALGLCASQLGRFHEALAAERRAQAIARAIGDAALEVSATWATGITRAALGEWDDAIADCQRAVAAARDVLYRALATAFLGFAYTEKGYTERELAEPAIAALRESIPLVQNFRLKAYEGWFRAFFAEAHRLAGHLESAEELAQEARRTASEARFPVGVGWAQHVLGRVALDRHDLDAAATRLDTALKTFTDAHSRYEWARVRVDLARACHARGDDETARAHLEAARGRFVELDVPRHRERVERLAAEWALTLGA